MALSVISALTRLGIDPWEEAARLAALPKALAAEALAPMIARLPVDRLLPSDNAAISHRLVELLPMPGQAAPKTRKRPTANEKRYFRILLLLACFALGMVVMTAIL